MADFNCPYCNAEQEVCHDDGHGYAEDVKHEHQCSECEKVFVFRTYICLSYEAKPADCLNDGIAAWNRRTPAAQAQRAPLGWAAMTKAIRDAGWVGQIDDSEVLVFRAAERAHGITQEKQG